MTFRMLLAATAIAAVPACVQAPQPQPRAGEVLIAIAR
jgi:hypothetical protein